MRIQPSVGTVARVRVRRPISPPRRQANQAAEDSGRVARVVFGHDWASAREWRQALDALADFSDEAIDEMMRAGGRDRRMQNRDGPER